MAKDALALIEHLHWDQCHIVGVSMGGMIGLELALLAPHKLLSLSLLVTHAGGLAAQAPFLGIYHLLRSFLIRDEHLQIQNALEMLYSPKTLSDHDKRKVSMHIESQLFLFTKF
jgi:pimeloyl-ACP methyl ester carboxylesterase